MFKDLFVLLLQQVHFSPFPHMIMKVGVLYQHVSACVLPARRAS